MAVAADVGRQPRESKATSTFTRDAAMDRRQLFKATPLSINVPLTPAVRRGRALSARLPSRRSGADYLDELYDEQPADDDPDRLCLGGDDFLYCDDSVADYLCLHNPAITSPKLVTSASTDHICPPPDCSRLPRPMSLDRMNDDHVVSRDQSRQRSQLAAVAGAPTYVDFYDIDVQAAGGRRRRVRVPSSWTTSCRCSGHGTPRATASRSFALYNLSVWPMSDRGLQLRPSSAVREGWVSHAVRHCSEHGCHAHGVAAPGTAQRSDRRWKIQLTDDEWLRLLRASPHDPIFRRFGLCAPPVAGRSPVPVVGTASTVVPRPPSRRRVQSSPPARRAAASQLARPEKPAVSSADDGGNSQRHRTASTSGELVKPHPPQASILPPPRRRRYPAGVSPRDITAPPPCNSPTSDLSNELDVSDDVFVQSGPSTPPPSPADRPLRDRQSTPATSDVVVEGKRLAAAAQQSTPRTATTRSSAAIAVTTATHQQPATSASNELMIRAIPAFSRSKSSPLILSTTSADSVPALLPTPRGSGLKRPPILAAKTQRKPSTILDRNNNDPSASSSFGRHATADDRQDALPSLQISVIVPC